MDCFFKQTGSVCGILNTFCNGIKRGCKFYKTEEQYIEEQNKAVLMNRKKGNCEKCKYRDIHCELLEVAKSTENIKI